MNIVAYPRGPRAPRGFTIVELLIAVVIIGILAVITASVYTSAQARARNTSRQSTAKAMFTLAKGVVAANGASALQSSLDYANNWYSGCLGTNLPDLNADGRGDCISFGGNAYASETAALNALASGVGKLPSMAAYPILTESNGAREYAPFLESGWVNGTTSMLLMEYSLEGEGQKCALGPLVYSNNGNLQTTPVGSGTYSRNSNGLTKCIVIIAEQI